VTTVSVDVDKRIAYFKLSQIFQVSFAAVYDVTVKAKRRIKL